MDRAEGVLVDFFQALNQEEYQTAADLYGGPYQILASYNPDLDPTDHLPLWERACTVNGFQCLRIGEVIAVERLDENTFTFTVQFLKASGDIFYQGPCCGAEETSSPPLSSFEFQVALDADGQYRVLDLPVYVP